MVDYAHNDEDHPRNSPHHDLLLINPNGVLHRIQVEKRQDHPNEGRYVSAPQAGHYREPGHRKVFNIAHAHAFPVSPRGTNRDVSGRREGDRNATMDRGPAFAMLPVKPEPASSNWACYLINAQRLAYKNPWTQAAWNDEPDSSGDDGNPIMPAPLQSDFELLVAGPAGDVYHLRSRSESVMVEKLQDLSLEQDIWNLLRNGCVVGTAEFYDHPDGSPKIVPLVNAACLVAPQGGR